jgi:ADP-heptose:LPS heptosyltransferase
MKTALISRFGAYGDIIHCSHLPRLLSDNGYKVDMVTNTKGYELMKENPFINKLSHFEPPTGLPIDLMYKEWELQAENYDLFVNLYQSLEHAVIAMESQNIYYMSDEVRRARYGNINYYDQSTAFAGYPELVGRYLGEIFFTREEDNTVKKCMEYYKGKFVVMINLSGTGPHKVLLNAKEVANEVLDKYPDAEILLTGGEREKQYEFKGDRITSIVGTFPFRQALHVSRYVDCVIGCESGIMCGANMWGTPTIQIMTGTCLVAHCKYARNDFSFQSPAKCSPCYKGPYEYYGCPHENGYPYCVTKIKTDEIVKRVGETYELRQKGYKRVYS